MITVEYIHWRLITSLGDKTLIKRITQEQFDTHAIFFRHPGIFQIAKEVAWYENDKRSLWGLILLDLTDHDYVAMIFARDDTTKKANQVKQKVSIESFDDAEIWVKENIEKTEQEPVSDSFHDESKRGVDLFSDIVNSNNIHPGFDLLNTQPGFSAAKGLISELSPYFEDVDGNFVEQFQTTGFDSRVWELFLHCYFHEEGLRVCKEHFAPDFMLSNGNCEIGLEAVTVGRKKEDENTNQSRRFPEDIEEEVKGEMPIRFGSPLFSKLSHSTKKEGYHYWEFPHTKDKPFVLAIADFHKTFSMTWSSAALREYLYGYTTGHIYDAENNLLVIPHKIDEHVDSSGKKRIPSGFFFQDNAEIVSAVLFSASGTISKFNRIGKQRGFGSKDVKLMCAKTVFVHDANSVTPNNVYYEVTEQSKETWSEGVSVFHNPNAKFPLPTDFFPNAAHHKFDLKSKDLLSVMPGIYPFSVITYCINILNNPTKKLILPD